MSAMGAAQRARTTGVVYLLYLGAVDLAWILVYRWGSASRGALLMSNVLYIALAVLFYGLFKPVNRRLSLDAMLFCIVGSTIGILHVFGVSTGIRAIGFLAIFILLIGYLIIRSTFLPRFLGWLMVLSGLGWLAYLKPSIAALTHGHMSDFSFAVEGLLALWLVVKGVNIPRWEQQAGTVEASDSVKG